MSGGVSGRHEVMVHKGLDGIVAAATALSEVDGEAGELVIAGFPLDELAPNATFEETVYLLWNGDLPNESQLAAFRHELAGYRQLPEPTLTLLREVANQRASHMDALRMATGTLDLDTQGEMDMREQATAILARIPTIVAAYDRLLRGQEPVSPDPSLGHTANFLHMLTGERPSGARIRALETYLNTVVDHGLNASTFAARVIIATQSDLVSAVTGAIGALKGPLHGGAPGPALDMVFEIGTIDRAESVLREKLERGERLMGFGHRIYKVRDPRADVLAAAATRLDQTGDGDPALYELATQVEAIALRLLEEYKPGRRLQTNVEYYTALLLHSLGLETEVFTPTFAISRTAGWIAHAFEQLATGRIIRPQSIYTGVRDRRWPPASDSRPA